MPINGSQQDQMKSWPIAQVRSGDVMTVWIVVIRTMEAIQTLEKKYVSNKAFIVRSSLKLTSFRGGGSCTRRSSVTLASAVCILWLISKFIEDKIKGTYQ